MEARIQLPAELRRRSSWLGLTCQAHHCQRHCVNKFCSCRDRQGDYCHTRAARATSKSQAHRRQMTTRKSMRLRETSRSERLQETRVMITFLPSLRLRLFASQSWQVGGEDKPSGGSRPEDGAKVNVPPRTQARLSTKHLEALRRGFPGPMLRWSRNGREGSVSPSPQRIASTSRAYVSKMRCSSFTPTHAQKHRWGIIVLRLQVIIPRTESGRAPFRARHLTKAIDEGKLKLRTSSTP